MIVIFGQASSFDVGPSLSMSRKIIRAQLAIVLPLGYTPLQLRTTTLSEISHVLSGSVLSSCNIYDYLRRPRRRGRTGRLGYFCPIGGARMERACIGKGWAPALSHWRIAPSAIGSDVEKTRRAAGHRKDRHHQVRRGHGIALPWAIKHVLFRQGHRLLPALRIRGQTIRV